jgi:hypothetical protein
MSTGTQKNMAYDHPSYTTRQSFAYGPNAAGSAGVTSKFVTHAALLLFGLNYYVVTAGTSTYTFTQGGTSTVAVAATQASVIVITNTATPGATVALATTTYGPYTVAGNFLTSGTLTNQVGQNGQFQLNTNTGTAGIGGVLVPAGSQVYVVNGTDATAVVDYTIDYQIQPLASVLA